ncbi:MAG: glutaminyl-peptide cyclotransferase, partial [Alistipes sp.]|nr:glutaminyl-peptide cyclotransferase [Alistipes sp.]
TNNLVHIYNLEGKLLRNERYPGEGWGLTTDGQTLYMSDGSTYIYRVNPETFKREGKITVTLRGHAIEYINELEWIEGKIWANVYTANEILIIDPASGIVEGVVSFSDLQKAEDIKANTDVFNGIAYDKEQKRIFVTGKNWNKLYEIEIVKR